MSELRALIEGLLKRRKAFLWLFLALVGNALVFVGVTARLANKQDRLVVEREKLRGDLEQKKEELRLVSDSESLVARNADAVRRFWSDVVKERAPGLTEAWDEIDRLAGETNVKRGRTGYDRELLEIGLEQIRATMPVEGNYFDLVRFINRLERSERFFLVEQLAISQKETELENIQLACSIAFYLKGGGPTPPGVASLQPERSASRRRVAGSPEPERRASEASPGARASRAKSETSTEEWEAVGVEPHGTDQ